VEWKLLPAYPRFSRTEPPMIVIQVIPRTGHDAYQLLRSKVIHEAATWYWGNKKKTRLKHLQSDGHIEVAKADGVLVARVHPKERRDLFYLAEKFMGRLVAWFEQELVAINLQLVEEPAKKRKRKR
jgi:hypothetical protein